jgi:hypothetical protein
VRVDKRRARFVFKDEKKLRVIEYTFDEPANRERFYEALTLGLTGFVLFVLSCVSDLIKINISGENQLKS